MHSGRPVTVGQVLSPDAHPGGGAEATVGHGQPQGEKFLATIKLQRGITDGEMSRGPAARRFHSAYDDAAEPERDGVCGHVGTALVPGMG